MHYNSASAGTVRHDLPCGTRPLNEGKESVQYPSNSSNLHDYIMNSLDSNIAFVNISIKWSFRTPKTRLQLHPAADNTVWTRLPLGNRNDETCWEIITMPKGRRHGRDIQFQTRKILKRIYLEMFACCESDVTMRSWSQEVSEAAFRHALKTDSFLEAVCEKANVRVDCSGCFLKPSCQPHG